MPPRAGSTVTRYASFSALVPTPGTAASSRDRPRHQPVRPPAGRRQVPGDEGQRPPVPYAGHRHAGVVGQRPVAVDLDADQVRPGPGQSVEDGDGPGRSVHLRHQVGRRGVEHLPARGPGVPPAGQQVEVDLVALGAGDRVVVGAVEQLPPGPVQGRVRKRAPCSAARVANRSPSATRTSACRLACLVSM